MRTDILDLHRYYESPLGRRTARFIRERLKEAVENPKPLRIAGFGYTGPYLNAFPSAERRLNLAPGAQGVIRWPASGPNGASMISDFHWPFPDASLDRVFLIHGLEETSDPRRLLREIWRVLAPDGRLIVVAAHRRGLWSMVDNSPFAAGRPYSRRQLAALLTDATFSILGWSGALYFPPVQSRILLRAAPSWERAGRRLWPGLSGVLLAEASKELLAPIGKMAHQTVRIQRRAAAARPSPGPARNKIKREGA